MKNAGLFVILFFRRKDFEKSTCFLLAGLEVLVYMDDKRKKRSKGMGLVSTLVTLFIILKFTKVISWSWLWVFSPIWITIIIAIVVFGSILVAGRIIKGKW